MNHLEIAAKCWARREANEIKGVIIATALEKCAATVPDLTVMKQAEDHIERWLASWLARNLLTFTDTYNSEDAVNSSLIPFTQSQNPQAECSHPQTRYMLGNTYCTICGKWLHAGVSVSQITSAAPDLYLALKALYSEAADYIRINNLGDVHHNHSMQIARDALAKADSK